MTTFRVSLLLSLALAGLALAGPLEAQVPPRQHNLLQTLDLTANQRQQIRRVMEEYHGQIVQHARALHQAEHELQALMAGDAPANVVRVKYRQVQRLRQQLIDLKFASSLKVRQILNLQQRHLLEEELQARHHYPNS